MTGKNVATVSKRSQYPIAADAEIAALVDALVGFKNRDGTYELRRAITAPERRQLEARRNNIVDNLGACNPDAVLDDIIEMLMGFDSANFQNEEAARMVASQYAHVLAPYPSWAVKRACGRWARGEVKPDEIGERSLSRRAAPSTAQVAIVAENIVRPHRQELVRLNQTLKAGSVPKPPTEDERKIAAPRIQSMFEEVAAKGAEADLAEQSRVAAVQAEVARKTRERNEYWIKREYLELGLTPPTPLHSLSTMLSLGYEVRNFGGKNVLLRPEPAPPREPKERPDMST